MKIHPCEQRSADWHKLRLGIPTASEAHRIVTPTGKLSAQAGEYMCRLLAEWFLGAPMDSVNTGFMQRGSDLEDEAVRCYQAETGLDVEEVGFVSTDDGMVGCSPDRLVVAAEGQLTRLLEIKVPKHNTHIGYLLSRAVDKDYWPQVQCQMYVCERDAVDVVSYCPPFPSLVMTVKRDDKFIAALKEALDSFVETLAKARERLQIEYGMARRVEAPKAAVEIFDALGVSDSDVTAIFNAARMRTPGDR